MAYNANVPPGLSGTAPYGYGYGGAGAGANAQPPPPPPAYGYATQPQPRAPYGAYSYPQYAHSGFASGGGGGGGGGGAVSPWRRVLLGTQQALVDVRRMLSLQQRGGARVAAPEVMRVNQLDAIKVDGDLNGILMAIYSDAFKYCDNAVVEKYWLELRALFRAVVYVLSVYTLGNTYGNLMENVQFVDRRIANDQRIRIDRRSHTAPGRVAGGVVGGVQLLSTSSRIAIGVLDVFVRYAWAKVGAIATAQGWRNMGADPSTAASAFGNNGGGSGGGSGRGGGAGVTREQGSARYQLWVLMNTVETIYRTLALLNTLVFLYEGRYPRLLYRLLRVRLLYVDKQMPRSVTYEYVNRQIVLNGFLEFFAVVGPYVSFKRMRATLRQLVPGLSGKPVGRSVAPNTCPACNSSPPRSPYVAVSPGSSASVPSRADGCSHTFCYFCVQTGMMAAPGKYVCPGCVTPIRAIARYSHDHHFVDVAVPSAAAAAVHEDSDGGGNEDYDDDGYLDADTAGGGSESESGSDAGGDGGDAVAESAIGMFPPPADGDSDGDGVFFD